MTGSVIIRLIGPASAVNYTPLGDLFLRDANVNAARGRGTIETTSDPARAKRFASKAEAWAYWGQQSEVKPRRPDGRPNRPLTAWTVLVEPAP